MVLPAYNEEDALPRLIDSLVEQLREENREFEILVVNDGSQDKTRQVAEAYSGKTPVRVYNNATNRGLAETLRTGLLEALKLAAKDDIIITMDADNTHPAGLVIRMAASPSPPRWKPASPCKSRLLSSKAKSSASIPPRAPTWNAPSRKYRNSKIETRNSRDRRGKVIFFFFRNFEFRIASGSVLRGEQRPALLPGREIQCAGPAARARFPRARSRADARGAGARPAPLRCCGGERSPAG